MSGYKPLLSGKLYQEQSSLPKLPVPTLEETLPKYLKSLEPLLSKDQLQQSKERISQFLESGEGKTLQTRLEDRAKDPNRASWLEEWWNDLAYLGYRDPVVPFVSYFYAYKDDKKMRKGTKRAAAIVSTALKFWKQVVDETIEPEMVKKVPLCSNSYQYMFNTCRIPKKPSDVPVQYDPELNKKITVVRNGIFYTLPITFEGSVLSISEIESQLEAIIKDADGTVAAKIGVLTGDYRDKWAENREILLASSPENQKLLEEIESSIFLLCLDNTNPITQTEHSRGCWHGDGRNRFFDKPCQFIVFENGKAGFQGEHSMMDGTPTARLNEFVLNETTDPNFDFGSPVVRSNLPHPKPLIFKTDVSSLKAIQEAGERFDHEIGKQQLFSTVFHGYGKNIISKTFGFSPDAFAQMIIQLAYYKLHGKCVPTYEPAQTRKFARGRTEACRVVSNQSVAWVKAMEDPSVSNEEKVRLLSEASASHSKYIADAANGKGVDRHLLGLKLSVKSDEKMPSIFTDPAYGYSSSWRISTSNISIEKFSSWGWSEVVPDGYGIAYSVIKDSLQFNVTCMTNEHNLSAEKLCQCLIDAATDVREVLVSVAISKVKSKI
ncbi:hypothetical protein BB558_006955 [Smittium angustum]|nr:hypothetical protein BB558_006955 [Smittium angustum]